MSVTKTKRVGGADLGKARAKFVVALVNDDGSLAIESEQIVAHDGQPLDAFREWYRSVRGHELDALSVTGLHADEVLSPALTGLPEEACVTAALQTWKDVPAAVNIVSVGARGYSVLTRDARGRVQHLENDKCSSGTGETIVKTAARFGMSISEADAIATTADSLIPITARCSVFAKSEMTHFGNQGRPTNELFRGYFDSIARYVAALLVRVRVDGPVYLTGGLAHIVSFRRQLEAALGQDVLVPEWADTIEALGAAQVAGEHALARDGSLAPLPEDPAELLHRKERVFRELPAAREHAHLVRRLSAPSVPDGASEAPTVLGLDLGSTGSKAVLTSLDTGEIVLDVYDRTRGNPVEASQRLIRTILEQVTPDVRAIGVTGSGREAVATVLRASFPAQADRIEVVNEIVAHATAAARCDEDGGKSLSVVEIGGQDAKFVQVSNGRIIESDMNKACSAGTGSFLEEQAAFYGVDDIGKFTRLAASAGRAPDLGQMCTVFVAEAAEAAHQAGFDAPELFAGFQYSVIHNYLNRVMGQRAFGEKIFFQGKPASGESLAWTLAAVTGREVVVPPNPGAMGAWGIGLCAFDSIGKERLRAADPLDISAALRASIAKRAEFQCKDKDCATLCTIERTTVAVGRDNQTVFSGGACPKYEIAAASRKKLPREAPSAFDEREALLAPFYKATPDSEDERDVAQDAKKPVVGIPEVGSLAGFIPWATTLLRELGLNAKVLRSDKRSLSRGEERCHSYDSCAPMKIAHGVADGDADVLFMPTIVDIGDRDAKPGRGGKICSTEQAMSRVVGRALKARGRDITIVDPPISLANYGEGALVYLELFRAAKALGVKDARVLHLALKRGGQAQREYEARLAEIGERTLSYGRAHGIPVVVLCGSLHVIFDPVINAGIPKILQENGVLPLPMDCFPIPANIDALRRIVWGDANRAIRVALACRARGDAFPLLLSSFGCGPASFVEQIFDYLMRGYPRTALETDGHGGAAGYVTRIQSFLHGVRQYDGGAAPIGEEGLRILEDHDGEELGKDDNAELVMLPIGDRLGAISAAAYRSMGFNAQASPIASHEVLAEGRRDCSGKECLPYQLIWGSFRQHIAANGTNGANGSAAPKKRILMQVTGQGSCRNCMFSTKDQMSLEHIGAADNVTVRHFGSDVDARTGFFLRFWAAGIAWDVLNQLAAYHRAAEPTPGEATALYQHYCDRIEELVERPTSRVFSAIRDQRRLMRGIRQLVSEAGRDFARLSERANEGLNVDASSFRTVFLTGDIYLRVDDFANDGLVHRLNQRGVRVLVEPVNIFLDYFVEERSAEIFGLPTGFVETQILKRMMRRQRRAIYLRAQEQNPWLPTPSAVRALELGAPILGRHSVNEAPITVGSVLHSWRERTADGVVLVAPWGCGPALVAEGMLRHEREIPMLFLYSDGSPIDDRKLNGFIYQLQRDPPHAAHEPLRTTQAASARAAEPAAAPL